MLQRTSPFLLLSISLFAGCETILVPPPEELDLWADASAGVVDLELRLLCEEVWEYDLSSDPFFATRLGDPRYHGETPRLSPVARKSHILALEALEARLRTIRQNDDLSGDDLLNTELLEQKLHNDIALAKMRLENWNVDPLEGPHIQILNLTQVQPVETARERKQLVQRWNKFPRYLRESAGNLKIGKARDQVATRVAIEKTIRQVDEILAVDVFDSPLVTISMGGGRWVELPPGGSVAQIAHRELGDARDQSMLRQANPHLNDEGRLAAGTRLLIPAATDELSPAERGEFMASVLRAVEQGIYPALQDYRKTLQEKILPTARSSETPGLLHLAGGVEDYKKLIHYHTSLPLEECDARAIHDIGLQEVARIRSEIAVLGQRLFGTSDVALVQERLRSDPEMHFRTREEIEGKAVEALARAENVMAGYFGILPLADCEVVRISPYEEKDATIAYYRRPAPDGSLPGRYFINTFAPETRPRYEAEVLAYHEGVPGHHLQIAIAQELTDIPLFRRHTGSTAFVEGWALYTERLCDEMGLYSGDLDRLGVLSFDAWRACRLVVDTGMHAFGWSRQKAIDYMYENTLLARNNIANEVDRYIAWPGQALAYKIGQREIMNLRDQARAELGEDFDDKEFHDHVLENGAVTLASLRGRVERWLEER